MMILSISIDSCNAPETLIMKKKIGKWELFSSVQFLINFEIHKSAVRFSFLNLKS